MAQIRGFGLRLWSARHGNGAAFAVRTSDINGKSIRKTFEPFGPDSYSWRWQLRLSTEEIDFSQGIPLGFFLEDARRWAKKVVAQAKGRIPTDEEQVLIDAENLENRNAFEQHLEKMTLGRAAEIIISYGPYRGWSGP